MLLSLSGDDSETVSGAVSGQLLPVLLDWAAEADTVSNSLLPKVVSEIGKTLRQAVAQHSGSAAAEGGGGVPSFQTLQQQHEVALSGHLLFPNHDFQVPMHVVKARLTDNIVHEPQFMSPTLSTTFRLHTSCWHSSPCCSRLSELQP